MNKMMTGTKRPATRGLWAVVAIFAGLTAVGCAGSGSGTGEPEPEGPHGPIDFTVFGQDRHVVGGDWYLYDEAAGHILEPFPEIYVLREADDVNSRYAAFEIDSYYDPNTGDSGTFSFRYTLWSGAMGWTDVEAVATPNIKAEGDFCFDFFAGEQADCATSDWQAVFRIYPFLVQTGPIIVSRPGVFVRTRPSDAGTVNISAQPNAPGLDGLSDPTTLSDLVEEPPSGWDDPVYNFAAYGSDLPTSGRVLGPRLADEGFRPRPDVYMLLAGLEHLVRFTISPVTIGDPSAGIVLRYHVTEVNPAAKTISRDPPARAEEETVISPSAETMIFVDFLSEGARLPGAELNGTFPPDVMPDEKRWQLALEWKNDGISVRVSSASALFNGTRQSSAQTIDALPPVE